MSFVCIKWLFLKCLKALENCSFSVHQTLVSVNLLIDLSTLPHV